MLISIAILSVFSLHCPLFLFCLSCYLHLSLFSLSRTLIWKEGALLPTQYVLFLPAALSCWTPPQDPALLDKTQGIHAFLFCFISIYRLRRRSTLSRPEGEKGKLIPIQRVVKVWWMSALKQHDSGGLLMADIEFELFCSVFAGKTSTRGPKISDYFDVSITKTALSSYHFEPLS